MKKRLMARHAQRGFTLIEIMVVVAIIGILAAVAYPSYIDSVRRSARADAQSDIMQIAQTAERFFTLNNRYDQTRVAPPAVPAPFVLPMNQSPRSGGARYNINIAFPTPQSYVLQAVPAGSQVGDVCGTLAVNEAGTTTPALGTDGRACW
ncbi:MAG: hypothetical protein C0449_18770 [Polaromonas sp.]|nr:hypothetical protein [Polaromonas sp.]